MRSVTRLGLTGGIGSGKSTVAGMLSRYGAAVIDADLIARQATAAGGLAIEPIKRKFGADFINADGALDRDRMRTLAFNDPESRRQLEHIVHPLVGLEARRQVQTFVHAGTRLIVFDIPLLVESSGWRAELDLVLVIDCAAQTQIDRVVLRSALTRDEVSQILSSQASRVTRLQASDIVICNDALSLQRLEGLVQVLAQRFGL